MVWVRGRPGRVRFRASNFCEIIFRGILNAGPRRDRDESVRDYVRAHQPRCSSPRRSRAGGTEIPQGGREFCDLRAGQHRSEQALQFLLHTRPGLGQLPLACGREPAMAIVPLGCPRGPERPAPAPARLAPCHSLSIQILLPWKDTPWDRMMGTGGAAPQLVEQQLQLRHRSVPAPRPARATLCPRSRLCIPLN